MSAFSTQAHVTDDLFGGDLARASPTTAVNEPCHCATPVLLVLADDFVLKRILTVYGCETTPVHSLTIDRFI